MRLALLAADHVDEVFERIDGDLPNVFKRFFERGGPVSMDVFDVTRGELPPERHACDAFVLTGSRSSAYGHDPWILRLRAFVRDRAHQGARFVGFCFGQQVIAEALGGRVARTGRGWDVGVRPLTLRRHAEWMQPHKERVPLLFNHRDYVVEPPPGSVVLAGDDVCPVQMFTLGDQVLGLQAHPEYSIRYQEALMSVAQGLPRDALEDAKRRNRERQPDDLTALRWIERFIRGAPDSACALHDSRRDPSPILNRFTK